MSAKFKNPKVKPAIKWAKGETMPSLKLTARHEMRKGFVLINGGTRQTVQTFESLTTADATDMANAWCKQQNLNPAEYLLSREEE